MVIPGSRSSSLDTTPHPDVEPCRPFESIVLRVQPVGEGWCAVEELRRVLDVRLPVPQLQRDDRRRFPFEILAKPGDALLTPAAAAALQARTLQRVSLYRIVTYGNRAIPVQRLRLSASRASRGL